MGENKTQPRDDAVAAFLAGVDDNRRHEAEALITLMNRVTGEAPVMWRPSIIGFGRYRYRYESGREGEMARVSFSPRKPQLVLYGLPLRNELLARLGKHSTGKGCLYVKNLADVDAGVLEKLVRAGYETQKVDEV